MTRKIKWLAMALLLFYPASALWAAFANAGFAHNAYLGNRILYAYTTQYAWSSGATRTYLSYTAPANTFNGRKFNGVTVRAWGTFADNACTKKIILLFGSVTYMTYSTTSANTKWFVEGRIYRESANSFSTVAYGFTPGAGNGSGVIELAGQAVTETGTVAVKVNMLSEDGGGCTAATGDIVGEGAYAEGVTP